jgi:hypothetical protein
VVQRGTTWVGVVGWGAWAHPPANPSSRVGGSRGEGFLSLSLRCHSGVPRYPTLSLGCPSSLRIQTSWLSLVVPHCAQLTWYGAFHRVDTLNAASSPPPVRRTFPHCLPASIHPTPSLRAQCPLHASNTSRARCVCERTFAEVLPPMLLLRARPRVLLSNLHRRVSPAQGSFLNSPRQAANEMRGSVVTQLDRTGGSVSHRSASRITHRVSHLEPRDSGRQVNLD